MSQSHGLGSQKSTSVFTGQSHFCVNCFHTVSVETSSVAVGLILIIALFGPSAITRMFGLILPSPTPHLPQLMLTTSTSIPPTSTHPMVRTIVGTVSPSAPSLCRGSVPIFNQFSTPKGSENPKTQNKNYFETLNLKATISPSCITYPLPSVRNLPAAFTACSLPNSFKSSYFITSAAIKPRSKSV